MENKPGEINHKHYPQILPFIWDSSSKCNTSKIITSIQMITMQ